MNIVITERNSVGLDIDVERFRELGELTIYSNTVGEEQTAERIADADIIVSNKAPLNRRTLAGAPHVRFIAEFATGFDNVDLEYCAERGITVSNVRNYSTDAVAQHTIAMALYICEHLHYYDTYVKSGCYGFQTRFSNFDMSFNELAGKTWGIIGMGNIGKKVASIASAFGCKVIFHSVTGKSSCTDYEQVDFDTLLKTSDFLSLHCPLSDITRNLINADTLSKMKPSAILLNVARGAVVNGSDLYDALVENRILGAGLDVLEAEPISDSNPLRLFLDSNRLIITPHMAWASIEARERCVAGAFENTKNFLNGTPTNVVCP